MPKPVLTEEQIKAIKARALSDQCGESGKTYTESGGSYTRQDRICAMVGMLLASPVSQMYLDYYRSQSTLIAGTNPNKAAMEMLPTLYAELVRDATMLVDQSVMADHYIDPFSRVLIPVLAEPGDNPNEPNTQQT